MYKISKLAAGSVIAATAALGGASTVLADGYQPRGRAVYERPSDWSGVYFGVGSGYQWSSIDVTGPAIGISSDHDNAFVSAHLGVQHQFGNAVLGIEGGWMSSLRDKGGDAAFCDSVVPVLTAPILAPGNFCRAQLNDILTIGGRIGWAAGHWMPYVSGGYASGSFDFNTRTPALVEQAHARLGGWYVGGGFEWKISRGWSTGLEYRHYEFDTGTTTAFTGTGAAPLETVRFDAATDTITARVSWRWDREVAAPLK